MSDIDHVIDSDPDDEDDGRPLSERREEMLNMLEDSVEELHNKATSGRIYDEDAEKVRIQYHRALAYAVSTHRQLARDADIDELRQMYEELKEEVSQKNGKERVR
jgi:hypothetical protein